MIKLAFKKAMAFFTILSTALPSSLVHAASIDKANIYDTQLGCMGCHQGAPKQIDDNDSEIAQDNQIRQNHVETGESQKSQRD